MSTPGAGNSGLRRLGAAAAAVGAATALSVGGAAIFAGGGGSASVPSGPHTHISQQQLTQTAPWRSTGSDYYRLGQFCDRTTNTTLYVSEADRGGGLAAIPGCTVPSSSGLIPVGGTQSLDGDYYSVAEFCDPTNHALLYVTQADSGGGVAAVADGCAVGAAKPGKIVPVAPSQSTGGDYYSIRAYRDTGTGNLLYVTEADRGGSIAVVPGAGNAPAGDVRQLSSSTTIDGDYYSAGKFCDIRNGTLLYVSEADQGGGVAAVAGGCEPVANGTVALSPQHGNPHLTTRTSATTVDGDYYTVNSLRDGDNGNVVYASENDRGGGLAVVPAAPGGTVDGVG